MSEHDRGQQFAPGASIPPRPDAPPPSPPVASGQSGDVVRLARSIGYVASIDPPDMALLRDLAKAVAGQEIRVVLAEGVIVRPGDTLVIQLPEDTPLDEVDAIFATIKERLPDDCRALVLGSGIHVNVLRGNDSRPALDVPAEGITHCSWCPEPSSPRARYHLNGSPEHIE